MARELTTIEKLKAGEKRREMPDGRVGGLYHVVQPSGARSWAYRYRFAGKPRKFTFQAGDLKAARKKAGEAKDKIAEGIDPGADATAEIVLAAVGEDRAAAKTETFREKQARAAKSPNRERTKKWMRVADPFLRKMHKEHPDWGVRKLRGELRSRREKSGPKLQLDRAIETHIPKAIEPRRSPLIRVSLPRQTDNLVEGAR